MILDNRLIDTVAPRVNAHDFYIDAHKVIFECVLRLAQRGTAVDAVTVSEELLRESRLDYVGGIAYVGALVQNVPTTANAIHYAQIVSDRARRRQIMVIGADLTDAAAAAAAPAASTLLAEAQCRLEVLSLAADAGRLTAIAWDELARVPVPRREFRVERMMPKGTTGLWAAHGGAGKTQGAIALGISLAVGLPFFGERVEAAIAALVSAEDDATDLHIRAAAQCAALKVDFDDLAGKLYLYDVSGGDPTLIVTEPGGSVAPTARYFDLKREFRRRGVEVVMLDNFAALVSVDVIKPGHVTAAIGLLSQLAPAGGNVVILAHVDKATARAGYGAEAYSGTAAFNNRCRFRWYLLTPDMEEDKTPSAEPRDDDGRRILEVQKINGAKRGTRLTMRIVTTDGPTQGALVGDGDDGGIVASIARNNERKAILEAFAQAEAAGIPVPTAETNSSTAYDALEAMQGYPESLRGVNGKRRLFRVLKQMLANREIEHVEFLGSGRHKRPGYQLARIEK